MRHNFVCALLFVIFAVVLSTTSCSGECSSAVSAGVNYYEDKDSTLGHYYKIKEKKMLLLKQEEDKDQDREKVGDGAPSKEEKSKDKVNTGRSDDPPAQPSIPPPNGSGGGGGGGGGGSQLSSNPNSPLPKTPAAPEGVKEDLSDSLGGSAVKESLQANIADNNGAATTTTVVEGNGASGEKTNDVDKENEVKKEDENQNFEKKSNEQSSSTTSPVTTEITTLSTAVSVTTNSEAAGVDITAPLRGLFVLSFTFLWLWLSAL